MTAAHREVQVGWLVIAAAVLAALALSLLMRGGPFQLVSLIPLAVIALAIVTFGMMTVTVEPDAVDVRMGIGLLRRRIPRASIQRAAVVRNPWYWGLGVRLYTGGTLYTVSGLRAVELTLDDGRAVRIGSRDPERLLRSLRP